MKTPREVRLARLPWMILATLAMIGLFYFACWIETALEVEGVPSCDQPWIVEATQALVGIATLAALFLLMVGWAWSMLEPGNQPSAALEEVGIPYSVTSDAVRIRDKRISSLEERVLSLEGEVRGDH